MNRQSGATTVEFALVLVIFLTFLLGIIDFSRIFAAKTASPRATEYIIERDDAGVNALTTAEVGFNFLKNIRF